jgi:glycosyltransferase involved in cell wall biosynthesis
VTSNANVSVVIPCFNSVTTIERALRSVEHQTTKPHEVLVVDDASSDNTVSIIEQYARASSLDIRIIKQSVNGGPSVARNAAWNVATSEFIAFLDADDQWHPQKLELQLQAMLENPTCVMSFHDHLFGSSEQFELLPFAPITSQATLRNFLLRNRSATPTVMLRAVVTERFTSTKRYAEDYLLWMTIIARHGNAMHIHATLAHCSNPGYGGSGQSGKLWKMERSELSGFVSLWRSGALSLSTLMAVSIWSITKYLLRLFDTFLIPIRRRRL